MKLLVVEDDEALAAMLRKSLSERHYQIDLATDGQAGWDLAEAFQYDLILLDWMLPGLDGLSFCQQLRAKGDLTPILMMTANEAQSSKVRGLDSGADDYLVKPFDFEELQARVRALLRRGKDAATPLLVWGDFCLDPQSCEVSCYGAPLHLTAKEYGLLELFLRYPQRIFKAGALLDSLWDFEDAPSENAVRAHIKTLRRKLREAGGEEMIETLYGLGYRLKPQKPQAQPSVPSPDPVKLPQPPVTAPQQETQTALREVWAKARQQYLAKLEQLEALISHERFVAMVLADAGDSAKAAAKQTSASETLAGKTMASEPIPKQIQRLLHSLKGGLGTFGLTEAAAIATQAHDLILSHTEDRLPHDLSSKVTAIRLLLEDAVDPLVSLTVPDRVNRKVLTQHCWLISQDEALWQRLVAGAQARSIALRWLRPRDGQGQEAWAVADFQGQDAPRSIILDLGSMNKAEPPGSKPGPKSSAISELVISGLPPNLPLIGLTIGTDLDAQVQAARLGCKRCLCRSESSAQVLSVAAELMQNVVRTQSAKILVVDDDHNLLQMLHGLLVPWGFQLTLLDDPKAFLQTLEAAAPDLVILDYEMPDFTGFDLCQVVRRSTQWQALPILFLSAHQDPTTLKSAFEAGANDYVSKPVNEPELIQRLLTQLERTSPGSKPYRDQQPQCQSPIGR